MTRGRAYPPERKERIMALYFRALESGWTLRRFSRVSKVPFATINAWCAEDAYFAQYRRAMEVKALSLPELHSDIVDRLINPKREASERLEAKVAGVALRAIEFRLMREFKGGVYQTQKTVNHRDVTDLTDEELDRRTYELTRKARLSDGAQQTRH